MSEERRAGPGGLLELPLVIVEEAVEAVPRLVDRTRRQVDLARRLAGHLPCVGGLLRPPEDVPLPAHEESPIDVLSVVAGDEAEEDGAADAEGPGDGHGPVDGDVPDSSELPVPDYDALAASQVVPRLTTLNPDELESVRTYERAHRNRQTILSKVAQLLDG